MVSRKTADKWKPFLNIMARINMEIDIAETCLYEPTTVELGRKELYELKRDWRTGITGFGPLSAKPTVG